MMKSPRRRPRAANWRDSLVEIVAGLYVVPGEEDGRFPFSNSLLVANDTLALVDTGAGIERLRSLRDRISIDLVIASHSHPDHTAGNWLFADRPLYGPEQAADTFGRLEPLSERFAQPGPLAAVWRAFVCESMQFQDAPPTHTFADGSVFDFGQIKLVALHTPGHVVDHYCFFEPTHGVLLSSDVDLTSFGPWYGHRESDILQFKASIRRVMALQPRIVVSSHKGIIRDDIQDRFVQFLAVFDEREAQIRDLLTAGFALDELVDQSPIYGGYPYAPVLLRYWELQMLHKHIDLIHKRQPG